jgi:hypothetical protein
MEQRALLLAGVRPEVQASLAALSGMQFDRLGDVPVPVRTGHQVRDKR